MEVLHHKGFGPKWKKWMQMIMSSGTSSILLNGVLRKTFHYRRGVRQGDPLSSLIFILVANLLQSILNSALHRGLLTLPLPRRWGTEFLVVQYTYDTMLFLEACPR
jgi:hypothetical protein